MKQIEASMDIRHKLTAKGLILGDIDSRTVWFAQENGTATKQLFPTRSQKLYNHSPDGFNWGYGGSGSSQLALALMLYYLNDEQKALQWYQTFKWAIIAKLPQGADFQIKEQAVIDWINKVVGE